MRVTDLILAPVAVWLCLRRFCVHFSLALTLRQFDDRALRWAAMENEAIQASQFVLKAIGAGWFQNDREAYTDALIDSGRHAQAFERLRADYIRDFGDPKAVPPVDAKSRPMGSPR